MTLQASAERWQDGTVMTTQEVEELTFPNEPSLAVFTRRYLEQRYPAGYFVDLLDDWGMAEEIEAAHAKYIAQCRHVAARQVSQLKPGQVGPVERALLLRIAAGTPAWLAVKQGGREAQQRWYLGVWARRGWWQFAHDPEMGWLTAEGGIAARMARALQALRNASRVRAVLEDTK